MRLSRNCAQKRRTRKTNARREEARELIRVRSRGEGLKRYFEVVTALIFLQSHNDETMAFEGGIKLADYK
jgi:hypothetical protein